MSCGSLRQALPWEIQDIKFEENLKGSSKPTLHHRLLVHCWRASWEEDQLEAEHPGESSVTFVTTSAFNRTGPGYTELVRHGDRNARGCSTQDALIRRESFCYYRHCTTPGALWKTHSSRADISTLNQQCACRRSDWERPSGVWSLGQCEYKNSSYCARAYHSSLQSHFARSVIVAGYISGRILEAEKCFQRRHHDLCAGEDALFSYPEHTTEILFDWTVVLTNAMQKRNSISKMQTFFRPMSQTLA